jgi:hypothetical protein
MLPIVDEATLIGGAGIWFFTGAAVHALWPRW